MNRMQTVSQASYCRHFPVQRHAVCSSVNAICHSTDHGPILAFHPVKQRGNGAMSHRAGLTGSHHPKRPTFGQSLDVALCKQYPRASGNCANR